MAKLGWKLAALCTALLLGGCGDEEDTGDTENVDQPLEYGVQAVLWQAEPLEPAETTWSNSDSEHTKA